MNFYFLKLSIELCISIFRSLSFRTISLPFSFIEVEAQLLLSKERVARMIINNFFAFLFQYHINSKRSFHIIPFYRDMEHVIGEFINPIDPVRKRFSYIDQRIAIIMKYT